MIMEVKTNRNTNGHCKYLAFDDERKIYSREPRGFISSDMVTIKAGDLQTLEDKCKDAGYSRKDYEI